MKKLILIIIFLLCIFFAGYYFGNNKEFSNIENIEKPLLSNNFLNGFLKTYIFLKDRNEINFYYNEKDNQCYEVTYGIKKMFNEKMIYNLHYNIKEKYNIELPKSIENKDDALDLFEFVFHEKNPQIISKNGTTIINITEPPLIKKFLFFDKEELCKEQIRYDFISNSNNENNQSIYVKEKDIFIDIKNKLIENIF